MLKEAGVWKEKSFCLSFFVIKLLGCAAIFGPGTKIPEAAMSVIDVVTNALTKNNHE